MRYINDEDRYFIENKYHSAKEPFDPMNRFGYHGYLCDGTTGLDDSGMKKELERLFEDRGISFLFADIIS